MTSTDTIHRAIRDALQSHGRLSVDAQTVATDATLYEAGLTSQCSVNVMLALEARFDLEFPDHLLTREVFGSIDAMTKALLSLGVADQA